MVQQPGLDGGGWMQVVTAAPIDVAVVVSWALRRMEQQRGGQKWRRRQKARFELSSTAVFTIV
jgi:hypothetical protein